MSRAIISLTVVFSTVSLIAPAWAQLEPNLTPLVPYQLPDTDPSLHCVLEPGTSQVNGERGVAIKCPIGTLRGFTDNEMGTDDPRRPTLINGNISAGNRQHPGYVVITPDVGKGLIVGNGEPHPKKLMLVRNPKWGHSEFRTPVWFKRGLVACDRRGCVDVMKALRARR